jgi:hypothetical protein
MNLKYLILSIVVFANLISSPNSVYAQEPAPFDSNKTCCEIVTALSLRLDSLEAQLEHLQIQVVESDPFKSAKYLKWGNGLTFTISKSVQRITTDIGYTLLTPKAFRMGIAMGYDGEFGTNSNLPVHSFYGKVTYGSPIFINFISINSYFRTLYYPKKSFTDDMQTSGGIGAGAEFEFWFMPSWCYTFGGSITAIRSKYEFSKISLGEINFAGIKFFPQCARKKK